MTTARSILEARQFEIGRSAKIQAIHSWAIEFFSGIAKSPINTDEDVDVGGSDLGWMFKAEIKKSYVIVDCDLFFNSEWQNICKMQLYFVDIDVETIGYELANHFKSVIADARFIS